MDLDKLQALLDDQSEWPSAYTFKFIGKDHHRDALEQQVGVSATKEQPSSSGKYISFTYSLTVKSSQEVIDVYKKVASISGIITL